VLGCTRQEGKWEAEVSIPEIKKTKQRGRSKNCPMMNNEQGRRGDDTALADLDKKRNKNVSFKKQKEPKGKTITSIQEERSITHVRPKEEEKRGDCGKGKGELFLVVSRPYQKNHRKRSHRKKGRTPASIKRSPGKILGEGGLRQTKKTFFSPFVMSVGDPEK